MKNNPNIKQLFSLFTLLLTFIVANIIIKSNNSEERVIKRISVSLDTIQNRHDKILYYFHENIEKIVSDPEQYYPTKDNDDNAIYIYENDNLIYWNSDANDPQSLLNEVKLHQNIFYQGNYIYYVSHANIDSIKFFTSTPLYHKNQFSINKNKFLPEKINGNYTIDFDIKDNKITFNIDYNAKMSNLISYIMGILLIAIYAKSLKLSFQIIQSNKTNNKYLWFLCCSIIIYVSILLFQNSLFISTSDIFGSSCLIDNCRYSFSLGALAEFSILIFSNVLVFSTYLKKELKSKTTLRIILSSLITVSMLLFYTYMIFELISNVNIPFSFQQIYNTTVDSYIFLIIISTLSCSLVILVQNILRIIISKEQPYIWSIVSILIIGAIFEIILSQFIDLHFSILTNITTILFYIIVLWQKKSDGRSKVIIKDIFVITLMTIQLTYILYLINETKERDEMEWFANIIGDESDNSFEEALIDITENLKKDKNLIKWERDNNFPSDDSILNYLNIKYFNIDEISNYNRVVTICDKNTILIVKDVNNYEINCNSLFDAIVENNDTKKISEELTLVDDPTTDSYYILKLRLSPTCSDNVNYCYIEFYKEYILNHIGIPEIITSHENILMPKLVNYSFCCYRDTILQYKYGFYNYPNELNNFRYRKEEYVKTHVFKHLTKKIDNKTIVVTIEKPRFIDIIAPFSYVFIILSLMYYLYVKFERKVSVNHIRDSFHGKMQLTIIMTLGFSFLVAGFTSFIFIKNSLNKKTREFNYEKNKTIVKNIESDLNNFDIEDREYLKKYKENHFTDINIYDLDGYLINTTQPKLFDGYKSKIINRRAFEIIKNRNRFFYISDENIDGTSYQSSYYPLKDKNGNTQAIINIPYFDNKATSRSSVSNFIITYINIILVLMGISAMVVILVTRKTIKPLEIIQDKMQKINLGEKNEIIEWKSKDEIGELINSYNKLIKELEISANKLMRSERETAWREMARQVAHEIKNPLTPMKLNIQFLQMAWDEKNPDIDKKLRDTTKSILEQIEILSNIASAFSDYAKLPKKNIEEFNLKELILNIINLYNNNENIKIELIEESVQDYNINSDKNNLNIVFGNILKNAIQAIGKNEDGLIRINIKDLTDRFLIKISDNGCGIGEEEKKKIFMPNFTTKSSGMGVGLSIVYDILETLGGNINFESETGKGTTFIIEIKKR